MRNGSFNVKITGAFHCAFQIQLARRGFTNVENIGRRVIQQLLDEINQRERNSEKNADLSTDKMKQAKIENIRAIVRNGAGKVDANRRSQLSVEKQRESVDRPKAIRNELLDLAKTSNSRQLKDFLEDAGESNQSMIWLVIFGVIFVATLLSLIR